jgi:hypothetical protein
MTTTPKTITKPTTVSSRHFQHHPEFAIGPEAANVTAWSLAVTTAVSELPAKPVDSYDCPLYRFAQDEDGRLKLVVERRVTKPRTLISGYKARQKGSGAPLTDFTLLDDAFDLHVDSEGFQLPETTLKATLEDWANQHRRLDGYQLLQCARAFSTLIAARHGCALGVNDQ